MPAKPKRTLTEETPSTAKSVAKAKAPAKPRKTVRKEAPKVPKPAAKAASSKTPTVKKSPSPAARKPRAAKPAKVIDPEEVLVRLCAEAALDKKALDPVILDMRGLSSFTDFFLIVSGTSEPQLKAIAASIREKVREKLGRRPLAEDGFPLSQWVVIDYGTVIIHVFHTQKRAIYGLEHLWGDAPRIGVADPSKP